MVVFVVFIVVVFLRLFLLLLIAYVFKTISDATTTVDKRSSSK